ncbi:hypothetical protein EC988_000389 [Linderina pennispora]|nr:hypothetical protein EC988_000389 [Linderina pennispora]
MTSDEGYQYKVVLAKVYFYAAQFAKCGEVLASVPDTLEESSLSADYNKQLYIAQMVMRGIIQEMDGKLQEALDTYAQALGTYRGQLSAHAVVVVPKASGGSTEEIVNWSEEALYRRALLSLSLGDKEHGMEQLGEYLQHMDSVSPPAFRVFRRLRANHVLLGISRSLYTLEGTRPLKQALLDGHQHQMTLLGMAMRFPRADDANSEVLVAVDAAAGDWNLTQAYSRTESLRLLELLYQAVHITYNSPQLMRHLVHTLIRFGDYHEAGLAFGTYNVLVERQLETVRKALRAALSEGGPRALQLGVGVESINDILETTITGTRLHLVHLQNPQESLALAHAAGDLIDEIEGLDPANAYVGRVPEQIKAQLALWRGAAHARLSQASREPENRTHHHTTALQQLQQAVGLAPRMYEAQYQLALEQAIGARDITSATASAKAAVALDARRLEAWHLLVLLATARKDYATAQRICDVALKQSEWWAVDCEIQAAGPSRPSHLGLVDSKPAARGGDIDSGIAYLRLRMTRQLIDSKLGGLAACLKSQPRMFALYGCVFGPVLSSPEGADDASAALELSMAADPRSAPPLRDLLGSRKPHSMTSGKRSLARSLARTMLGRHVRQRSAGSSDDHPATTGHARTHSHSVRRSPAFPSSSPSDSAPAQPAEPTAPAQPAQQPKRQRSMPHLRNGSIDSALAGDVPTEAYYDNPDLSAAKIRASLGLSPSTRASTISGLATHHSVYYSPIATHLSMQRQQASRALCDLWLLSAGMFVQLQRTDEAANAINEAVNAWPESPDALVMRGQLELARGQPLPALNEFHAAVALQPGNIRAAVGLARVEYLLGRRDVAIGLLKNITRAHGWSDPEAWYWLGRLEREVAEERDPGSDNQALTRAMEYTTYALELETTQPVRPFTLLCQ